LNADAKNPPLAALSSADVQNRIDDERRRLLIEQNLEHDLTGQRIAPLEAGDDAALDRVEAQINQCRDRQFRIQERMDILDQRLTQAKEREQNASLDALTEKANSAREIGERWIRTEYAKLAKAMAAGLDRLATIDAFIADANNTLTRAGRSEVADSNTIRCRPSQYVDYTATINVSLEDSRHPHHGVAIRAYSQPNIASLPGTNERVATVAQIPEQRHEMVSDDYQAPLYEAITLPPVDPEPLSHPTLPRPPAHVPIWQGPVEVTPAKIESLIADLTPTAKTRKDA